MTPEAYRELLKSGKPLNGAAPRARNNDPEHQFQCLAVECLVEVLPAEVLWTADAAGVRVSQMVAGKMKEAGVRRGWPDMRFLFPDGITRYIEIKARRGSLRPDQRVLRERLEPHGYWAKAKTWGEIETALREWCWQNSLRLTPLPSLLGARVVAFEKHMGLRA